MIVYGVIGLCVGCIIGAIIVHIRNKHKIQKLSKIITESAEKLMLAYDQIGQLEQDKKDLLIYLNSIKNGTTN